MAAKKIKLLAICNICVIGEKRVQAGEQFTVVEQVAERLVENGRAKLLDGETLPEAKEVSVEQIDQLTGKLGESIQAEGMLKKQIDDAAAEKAELKAELDSAKKRIEDLQAMLDKAQQVSTKKPVK